MSEVWDEALDEEDVKKEILLDENVPICVQSSKPPRSVLAGNEYLTPRQYEQEVLII